MALDSELNGMAVQLANCTDPVITQIMADITQKVQNGALPAFGNLNMEGLNKLIAATSGGNPKYKYEAIAKILFSANYQAIAARKANLAMIDTMLVTATQLLLNRQFMNNGGDMNWASPDAASVSGCCTNIISTGSFNAGVASGQAKGGGKGAAPAPAPAPAPADVPMPPAGGN